METLCKVCGGRHATGACTDKKKSSEKSKSLVMSLPEETSAGPVASKDAERIRRILDVKINDTAVYETQFATMEAELGKVLEQITPAEIANAVSELDGYIAKMEPANKNFDSADDTRLLLQNISQLKALKNRGAVLERLAKNKFYLAASGEHAYHLENPKLRDAVLFLSKAVTSLAEARFPEDLKRQQEAHNKATEKSLLDKRDELGKMKVSAG